MQPAIIMKMQLSVMDMIIYFNKTHGSLQIKHNNLVAPLYSQVIVPVIYKSNIAESSLMHAVYMNWDANYKLQIINVTKCMRQKYHQALIETI